MRKLAALFIVGLMATLTAGCDADPADRADASHLLTAEEVGGNQADSGTHLLTPVDKSCPKVDGPRVWRDADDNDVRSFTRTINGHPETTIIGAWPIPEDQATKVIGSIGIDPNGSCSPRDLFVEPGHLASTGELYQDGQSKVALEIHSRDKNFDLTRWAVRAYGYTHGHMVIVWVSRPDKKPSEDRITDLLIAQGERLEES